jgi:hypothetical protein
MSIQVALYVTSASESNESVMAFPWTQAKLDGDFLVWVGAQEVPSHPKNRAALNPSLPDMDCSTAQRTATNEPGNNAADLLCTMQYSVETLATCSCPVYTHSTIRFYGDPPNTSSSLPLSDPSNIPRAEIHGPCSKSSSLLTKPLQSSAMVDRHYLSTH